MVTGGWKNLAALDRRTSDRQLEPTGYEFFSLPTVLSCGQALAAFGSNQLFSEKTSSHLPDHLRICTFIVAMWQNSMCRMNFIAKRLLIIEFTFVYYCIFRSAECLAIRPGTRGPGPNSRVRTSLLEHVYASGYTYSLIEFQYFYRSLCRLPGQ
jgi:hypothetical protein